MSFFTALTPTMRVYTMSSCYFGPFVYLICYAQLWLFQQDSLSSNSLILLQQRKSSHHFQLKQERQRFPALPSISFAMCALFLYSVIIVSIYQFNYSANSREKMITFLVCEGKFLAIHNERDGPTIIVITASKGGGKVETLNSFCLFKSNLMKLHEEEYVKGIYTKSWSILYSGLSSSCLEANLLWVMVFSLFSQIK